VLSVGALLVSFFEVSAIRDEQRTQVWPYVELSTRYRSDGYEIVAPNKGIGLARIRRATLTCDGAPVTDLDTLIVDRLGEDNAFSYDLYRASDISQSVMSADESRLLLAFRGSRELAGCRKPGMDVLASRSATVRCTTTAGARRRTPANRSASMPALPLQRTEYVGNSQATSDPDDLLPDLRTADTDWLVRPRLIHWAGLAGMRRSGG
jgi:hypothetical protein